MTILELEQWTQLERATIRYYEREGLISPNRKENGYRDYSEEGANEILKIKLLRQLDLPIESIKQLQQGSANISEVLRNQVVTLGNNIEAKQRAADICKEISDNDTTYQNLDAALYLDKLTNNSDPAAPAKEASVWDVIVEYHPVRRFIARIADYALLNALIRFLIIVVLRVRPLSDFWSNVISYGCLLLSVPLQAILLHYFATTPGKWLMGIQVFSYKGQKLDLPEALRREFDALLYGMGLGIPFVRIWRLYRSYKLHKDRERLMQDIGIDHVYSHWDIFWHGWRKAFFAMFCGLLVVLYCMNVSDILKPKHRGNDLTVAEFAENFNFYSEIFDLGGKMNPDGTWYVAQHRPNDNVIVIGTAKAEKENEPFCFETEEGSIRRVTYQNTWHDVFMLQPIGNSMVTACITAVASQKGISANEILEFTKLIEEHFDEETAEIHFENIVIRWQLSSTNCIFSNGRYYAKEDEKASSVTASFEILIQ
jgi:DNA-binding transcriptional MerR regulator/uncharacterized RDD family membrane protein YckC